jgi:putative glycerol-1-phosphate prenyltransferase
MKFSAFIKKLRGRKKRALLAILIDPDKFNPHLIELANASKASCFLVGGSKLESGDIHKTVSAIKKRSSLPVILFPGDETQLTSAADGLFLPVLVSGRNPEYLIGKQVIMAPIIKRINLETLPMAYLLINGGHASSTQKVTQTSPLLPGAIKTVAHTAMAAELLGYKAVYLEAGSGAQNTVQAKMIKVVKKNCTLPLIVGGGIDSAAKANLAVKAGADMVVVGNALEKNVYLLSEISSCF